MSLRYLIPTGWGPIGLGKPVVSLEGGVSLEEKITRFMWELELRGS